MIRVDYEQHFNWWVLHTLKKDYTTIALIKRHSERYLKHNTNSGLNAPRAWKMHWYLISKMAVTSGQMLQLKK